jgi:proline iminopeptidase
MKAHARPARAGAATQRPRSAQPLSPAIEANRSGWLRVSDLHELYWEESGNPDGKPVVFLHGGPGGGTDPRMRRFFDPKRYRIVLFDQRGCGRSRRTHSSLVDNTTWHLVGDIERLRGTWASTAGRCSAAPGARRWRWPTRRRIPSASPSWCCAASSCCAAGSSAGSTNRPTAPRRCSPTSTRNTCGRSRPPSAATMMQAYYRRLTSDDPRVRAEAARAWSIWEGATSFLRMNPDYVAKFREDAYAAAFARIECHYFVNGGFLRRR